MLSRLRALPTSCSGVQEAHVHIDQHTHGRAQQTHHLKVAPVNVLHSPPLRVAEARAEAQVEPHDVPTQHACASTQAGLVSAAGRGGGAAEHTGRAGQG